MSLICSNAIRFKLFLSTVLRLIQTILTFGCFHLLKEGIQLRGIELEEGKFGFPKLFIERDQLINSVKTTISMLKPKHNLMVQCYTAMFQITSYNKKNDR